MMLRIAVIQPGATEFDLQGRIKGSLDLPLSIEGTEQVARLVQELSAHALDAIYVAPCRSGVETAEELARDRKLKIKRVKKLANLDHGLWHGKRIEEVKQTQPKVYRQCQASPETICPPNGESYTLAQQRIAAALSRITKRHKQGCVAIVVPEPMASLVRHYLQGTLIENLWQSEQDAGHWSIIELEQVPVSS